MSGSAYSMFMNDRGVPEIRIGVREFLTRPAATVRNRRLSILQTFATFARTNSPLVVTFCLLEPTAHLFVTFFP